MTVQDQPGSRRGRRHPRPKQSLDETDGRESVHDRRSVAFTQFSLDRVADPAFWMDARGRLIYVNQAACRLLGYGRDELLGMTVHEIDPDFPSSAWPAHWDELRQKGTMQFESHHRTRQGRVFPVEISANFIEFDGKQYNCAFARDISDRKHAEAERQRLLDALQEKNRELQNILFIASHDLRSPLVNVQGFAGELERACARLREMLIDADPKDPAEQAADFRTLLEEDIPEALRFIRLGIERIDSLVAGLLRLARIGSAALSLTRIDMNDLMASVVHAMRFQITQTQAQVQVDPLPPCHSDGSLLEQVFVNLIDNAIKYRKPDGSCCIRVTGTTEGPTVVYSVADNGIGIDPDDREKIFELFYRLRPDQNTGDGLGLTIVKRILDRLDGQIRVDSEPGRGSTFHVSLRA
jgi:two-component system, chemotaxis family, sensor kinase Cph1